MPLKQFLNRDYVHVVRGFFAIDAADTPYFVRYVK